MPEQLFFESLAAPDGTDPYFRVYIYEKIGEEPTVSGVAPVVQWVRTEYLKPDDPRIQEWIEWHCKIVNNREE